MTLLILGLALWSAAHLVKRVSPASRAALDARLGAGLARGLFAAAIGLGLLLMIVGYRSADFTPLYTPPGWTVHLNNVLMLVAVILLTAAHGKSRIRDHLRNPMLTGVVLWAIAHLLVNGDLASLILFAGMGLWAVASIALIDAAPAPATADRGTLAGDIRSLVIGLVAFAVIVTIHTWLGYSPFPA